MTDNSIPQNPQRGTIYDRYGWPLKRDGRSYTKKELIEDPSLPLPIFKRNREEVIRERQKATGQTFESSAPRSRFALKKRIANPKIIGQPVPGEEEQDRPPLIDLSDIDTDPRPLPAGLEARPIQINWANGKISYLPPSDGVYQNPETGEFEVWVDGETVAWADSRPQAERSFFEMEWS